MRHKIRNEAGMMENASKIDVYTDGECPLCQWIQLRVEPRDRDKRLRWLNFRDPQTLREAAPRTFDQMSAEMHAKLPDGRWVQGYRAWIEVLKVLPSWAWLASVMQIWPLTAIGPVVYRWIAAHRFSLFGIPPPCGPEGACELHRPGK